MKINFDAQKTADIRFRAEEKKALITEKIGSFEPKSYEPSVYVGQFVLPAITIPFLMKASELLKITKPTGFTTKLKFAASVASVTAVYAVIMALVNPTSGSQIKNSAKTYGQKVLEPYREAYSVLKDKITGKRPLNK